MLVKRFCSVFLLMLLPGLALAEQKIAVLDWRAALLGTNEAKAEFEKIRQSLSADEKEVVQLADQAKELQDKLKAEASKLSDDEKRQLGKALQEKAEEYQFLGQRLKKEQRQQQEAYVRDARVKLDEAVRNVIEQMDIDILLDRQAVTFVKAEYDLTKAVIVELNKIQKKGK
ncbi:OmpH family outer membrane protein [Oceanospirillum sediminis]|uniref:OmpH family outer membrane protein n=1 Tax=Oceanospirillum sediminis TaxID=2760088 RepID=A0A839IL44_9GAMM|nr:OmpH family outer membrane protein [Oceanospirillum sediminis]MBB1485036.1 OmpH family outer membrane protein [Oceanospirillum sediminis]